MLQYDPEDKAEYIEEFAPKNKITLLEHKAEFPDNEVHYYINNIAGLWQVRHVPFLPKNKRYELILDGYRVGYYPSMIQATRILTGMTYDEVFK